MGSADRIIRTTVAIVIGVLILTNRVNGTLAVVLGVLAVVFLLTSTVGVCPAYLPLGLSTRGNKPQA